MQTINQLDAMRSAIAALRSDGKTIALVPTMGALHEGHLTLIRQARQHADHVMASIFVNPAQFDENEDLDAYPRQLAADQALLEKENVALLWAPDVAQIYPEGFATNIMVGGVSGGLCGSSRPGHFDGVATIVLKLFNQLTPDVALFGEKDWQQLAVIRRMARDLDLTRPHASQIIGVPTVREADGLAMSSRNAYLSADNRAKAGALPAAMQNAVAMLAGGGGWPETRASIARALELSGFKPDYIELVDADTLAPIQAWAGRQARLMVAARIGSTRLIDNLPVALPVAAA